MGRNNWFVITGGPGSGKTTSINLIAARGYRTTIEHARHYIDTQHQSGRTIEEIRKNQEEFQLGVLHMQIGQEAKLSPTEIVFLDRAIPDAMAYYRFLHIEPSPELIEAMHHCSYRKIFILDCLPLVRDYARIEDEKAQQEIHDLLTEVYGSLGFPIVQVPVMPPLERVELILKEALAPEPHP